MVLQLSGRVGTEHHLSLPRILAQLLQERIDLAGGCWHGDLTFPVVEQVAPAGSAWTRRKNIFPEDILSHQEKSSLSGKWFGKWALITGASAGIGVAFAEELASGGTKLVLTARRKDRLEALARRLTATCKVSTEVFPADLADPSAPEKIFAFTKEKGIDRKSTRLNSSHDQISYAVFCLKKKKLSKRRINCH